MSESLDAPMSPEELADFARVCPLAISMSSESDEVTIESLRTQTRLAIPRADLPYLKAAIETLDRAELLLEKPVLDLSL